MALHHGILPSPAFYPTRSSISPTPRISGRAASHSSHCSPTANDNRPFVVPDRFHFSTCLTARPYRPPAHTRYHLKDVIVGKIYFLLVRIKIKHMELSIIRRETTGAAPNQYNESETITKFEIMDGAPVRGETIPIRLFLGGFELTPTFRDVNKKFSTRYYLNLVLIDEENRRYFKQQEITVFRIP